MWEAAPLAPAPGDLQWGDPAFTAQLAKYDSDDEDLFVVLDGDGRINDGLIDYAWSHGGRSRCWAVRDGSIPLLAGLLAQPDGRQRRLHVLLTCALRLGLDLCSSCPS